MKTTDNNSCLSRSADFIPSSEISLTPKLGSDNALSILSTSEASARSAFINENRVLVSFLCRS